MSRPLDWSPLRAADPVGGDPQEIAALARRYADTATAIQEASTSLHRIHDSATAWESGAGRAFRDRTAETAGTIERAFRRYEETAAALSRYATELEGVQDRADALLRRAQQDDDDARAARRGRALLATAVPPDPQLAAQLLQRETAASGRVEEASRALGDLEDEWDAAGRRAASAVGDVTSGDGLDDTWWDHVLDAVSGVTDLAGYLSTWLGVVALVCAVLPGLEEFAPVFAGLSLISGAMALAGHALLASNDRATVGDVLLDAAGVLAFGAGRAFRLAGEAMATGTRGAGGVVGATGGSRVARQGVTASGRTSGFWPTRSEWGMAYHPARLCTESATGTLLELPAAAGVQTAARLATASERAGVGLTAQSVKDSVSGHRPTSPVQKNRPPDVAMVLAGGR